VDVFLDTAKFLVDQSKRHQSVLVAFSGGKESMAVLDLCARSFRTVHVMHAYFVPGLEVAERQIEYAGRRWGVSVAQYQHPNFFDYLRSGVYCYESAQASVARIKRILFGDVLQMARRDCGADVVAIGRKRSDNRMTLSKKRNMMREGDYIYPLYNWRQYDVLAYLQMRKIPKPESDGRRSSSIDLTTPCLLWLHDHHPGDFKRIARYFPDVVAVPKRREWFGVGKVKEKADATA